MKTARLPFKEMRWYKLQKKRNWLYFWGKILFYYFWHAASHNLQNYTEYEHDYLKDNGYEVILLNSCFIPNVHFRITTYAHTVQDINDLGTGFSGDRYSPLEIYRINALLWQILAYLPKSKKTSLFNLKQFSYTYSNILSSLYMTSAVLVIASGW